MRSENLRNRHRRPVDGDRGGDGVHAVAVGETGAHQGARPVQPAPERGEDPVEHDHDLLGGVKHDVRRAELPAPLVEEGARAVDHDFRDALVLEQGLDGAEPAYLVRDLAQQRLTVHCQDEVLTGVEDGLEHDAQLRARAGHVLAREQGGDGGKPQALDEAGLETLPRRPQLVAQADGATGGGRFLDLPHALKHGHLARLPSRAEQRPAAGLPGRLVGTSRLGAVGQPPQLREELGERRGE